MDFVRNFPLFSILLPMVSGPISSVMSGKKAKWLNYAVVVRTARIQHVNKRRDR